MYEYFQEMPYDFDCFVFFIELFMIRRSSLNIIEYVHQIFMGKSVFCMDLEQKPRSVEMNILSWM